MVFTPITLFSSANNMEQMLPQMWKIEMFASFRIIPDSNLCMAFYRFLSLISRGEIVPHPI